MPNVNLGKGKPICVKPVFFKHTFLQSPNSELGIPDLKRENQFLSFFVIRIWSLHDRSPEREREMCKPVSKLDFKAHGQREFLLEFGLRTTLPPPPTLSHFQLYLESSAL
jgi:hypothetical protein